MLIDDLIFLLENRGDFYAKGVCVDCSEQVNILISRTEDGGVKIDGGAIYQPDEHMGYDEKHVYKCDNCFNKDKKIYARTETYSRVVGYIRPIKQFNDGKIAEYNQRAMFDLSTTPPLQAQASAS